MKVITLTTDFGNDWYVAAMKGQILSRTTEVHIIDVSHQVSPQDIFEGGFLLRNFSRWYPAGAIHVCVIDPGVGSERRAIVAKLANDQIFVCPDNGLLTFCLQDFHLVEAYYIENLALCNTEISSTFHGRDVFAPVAASIANGVSLRDVGSPAEFLCKLDIPEPVFSEGIISGKIIHIDSFGNAISNLQTDKNTLGTVEIAGIQVQIYNTYADVPVSQALALTGSSGFLEVAINSGNAAKELSISKFMDIKVILNS